MPEAISFDATRPWTKELPNGTVVQLREFDFAGPFAGRDPASKEDGPQCFRVEQPPGSAVEPHFHVADEFQLVALGGGRLGRHGLAALDIHYAAAYTPYGPIVADTEDGVVYFTLRPRRDPGALFLPAERDKLKPAPKRFFMAAQPEGAIANDILAKTSAPSLTAAYGPDATGAAAWRAILGAGQRLTPPKPAGDGYFVVVAGGGWAHDGDILPQWSCAFAAQGETPLELLAGPDGLDAVIMQFPERESAVETAAPTDAEAHECPLCGFIYDAADGAPDDGIPPGTAFQDLPDGWTCPNCDAAKTEFEAIA
jgi:rubredoxin